MTTTTTNKVDAAVVVYDHNGEAIDYFRDPVQAESRYPDHAREVFEFVPFKSVQRVSQALAANNYFKRSTRGRYGLRSTGTVTEMGREGFISVGYEVENVFGSDFGKKVGVINEHLSAVAANLRWKGFEVIVVPARNRGRGYSSGEVVVLGKAVQA